MLERKQLGHYRLIQRIGGGGMGEIYLAQDIRIERQVALKMVRAEVDPYPDAVASADKQRLFLREMQAITRLDHPRILPLYDFGEERDGNTIVTYMVMPYRPEGSLTDWLQKRGSAVRLSFQDVAYFVGQAAEALQHAHDHELIHQDVKPSNFLVRDHPGYPLPDLLLSDFGIARVMSATATASQSVRGTPTAMAPEQWQGNPEPATDQYALGIMAYILLVGRPPFSGRMEQLLHQHISVQPQPPGTLNPAIPHDLDSVILTALNKAPARRFGSVTAFARAFQQASSAVGFALPPVGNPAMPSPSRGRPVPSSPAVGDPATSPPLMDGQVSPPPVAPAVPWYPPAGNAAPLAPAPVYPVSGASAPRLPIVPPATPYPFGTSSPELPPTVAPSSPVPQPLPQQAVVLPPVREPQPSVYPPFQEQPSVGYPMFAGQPPVYPAYQEQSSPGYQPFQGQPPYSYPQSGVQAPAQPGKPARSRLLWALVAGAVALALIVSGFVGIGAYQNNVASANARSTADARSTVDTRSTGIAQATRAIQATSTAIASQATADAQATVNAQVTATAQVVASNPYPSYMAGSGTLMLFDSLQSPGNWRSSSNTGFGGDCRFANGSFHITQNQPRRFYYCQDTMTFGNFAVEVQMTILQGDCGGVIIRSSGSKLYYFTVCSSGNYSIWKYVDDSGSSALELTSGGSTAISGSGANSVGIVANGAAMTLYVNHQTVASISDGSYATGNIALTAQDTTNPTEVAYSNIRVWA